VEQQVYAGIALAATRMHESALRHLLSSQRVSALVKLVAEAACDPALGSTQLWSSSFTADVSTTKRTPIDRCALWWCTQHPTKHQLSSCSISNRTLAQINEAVTHEEDTDDVY